MLEDVADFQPVKFSTEFLLPQDRLPIWHEEFGVYLADEPARFIEPAWKMLLSNKGLLPILWELFPDHPNLLPCFESPEPLGGNYAQKPRLSRERFFGICRCCERRARTA